MSITTTTRWDASPLQDYPLPPTFFWWYGFIHLGREQQRGVKSSLSKTTQHNAETIPTEPPC